jgi:MoxR-like ATPase
MYATIIQSQSPYGVRQTAVIPLLDGTNRVLTRVGQTRGVSGAWQDTAVGMLPAGEYVIGTPAVKQLTPSDYRDLQYPITPATLMQKLVREVKDDAYVITTNTLGDVTRDIYDTIEDGPHLLAKYQRTGASMLSPTIQVTHQAPQPVANNYTTTTAPVVVDTEEGEPMNEVVLEGTNLAKIHVPEYEEYHERMFEGVSETEIYDFARSIHRNVLLSGHAGTGKTSSARNYAYKKNIPFVTVELTQQIDQSITQGRFVPTGIGNAMRWTYSQLATAIQQPSVVLLNELTRMTPKAASLFLRLLNERELLIEPLNEVIKVHPDCLILADQNIGLGYTGTVRQDNALTDRFAIKLEFTYDSKIEGKFIESPALLEFATSIRQASELNDQFSIPMSTRLLKNFQEQARGLSFKFAAATLLNSFPKSDGEREAIKMRFDASYDVIASELGVDPAGYINTL